MAGTTLVALRRSDRLEDVFPYLETVTQPDTKVVFLFHHAGFEKYLDTPIAKSRPGFPGREGQNRPKPEGIEPKTVASLDRFSCIGTVETALYAGGFRKAVHEYLWKEDVRVIVTPREKSSWLRRLCGKVFSSQQPLEWATLPPVVLYFKRSL